MNVHDQLLALALPQLPDLGAPIVSVEHMERHCERRPIYRMLPPGEPGRPQREITEIDDDGDIIVVGERTDDELVAALAEYEVAMTKWRKAVSKFRPGFQGFVEGQTNVRTTVRLADGRTVSLALVPDLNEWRVVEVSMGASPRA